MAAGLLVLSASPAAAQGLGASLQDCLEQGSILFSTEVDFLTLGPLPPDGNPIVSDGDLLGTVPGLESRVCARNADLLAGFGTALDLGLDAVDVVGEGEDTVVFFSTGIDGPGEIIEIRAGDLLATTGAVIPNAVLLHRFGVDHDVGPDALALPVPEPGFAAGLSAGIGLLASLGRRRRRREQDSRSDAWHTAPTADRSTLAHRRWGRAMRIGVGVLAGSVPFVGLVPIAEAGTVVSFGGATPPGSYDAVTPGGAFGPELDLPEATIDGGVRLTNYQPREDRLDDSVYATSDFSMLSDGSGLPGEITVDFTTPVRAVRVSIQDWYLAASFRLEGRASDDSVLASDTVALDVFMTDPGDAGRLTVVADEITRIVISSLQVPGEIDFAIDNLTYESGPVFTQDTPGDAVVIPAKLPATLSGSSRFVTTSGDEPLCNCGTATDGAPVWLRFAPGSTGPYSLDTSGSSYDTVVSVWRADDLLTESSPIEVACDDDSGAGFASTLEFQAEGGVEYLVLVTEYERDIGGDLVVLLPEPDRMASASAALLTTTGIAWLRRRRPAWPRRDPPTTLRTSLRGAPE